MKRKRISKQDKKQLDIEIKKAGISYNILYAWKYGRTAVDTTIINKYPALKNYIYGE